MDQDNTRKIPPVKYPAASVAQAGVVPAVSTLRTFAPEHGAAMIQGVWLGIAAALLSLVALVPSYLGPVPAAIYHGPLLFTNLIFVMSAWRLTVADPTDEGWMTSLRAWTRVLVIASPISGIVVLVGSFLFTPQSVPDAMVLVYGLLLLVGLAGMSCLVVYKLMVSLSLRSTLLVVGYSLWLGTLGLSILGMIPAFFQGSDSSYYQFFNPVVDAYAPMRQQLADNPQARIGMQIGMILGGAIGMVVVGLVVTLEVKFASRIRQQIRGEDA